MPTPRKINWESQHYHKFLLDTAKKPFKWGEHDCCLFAADGIMAITGTDIAADFRGKYDSKFSALYAIQHIAGGRTVEDAAAYCAEKHGLAELKHPLGAQRGDLVAVENNGEPIVGLIHLNGHVVAVGEQGLIRLPITSVKRAWRVR